MFNPQLTAFVCAADCGSFNKAAERLYLSPPSVMKQVNALEKHLQLTLLERDSHGIRLTPAGQVIYRHARFLFDYSARAVEEARRQEQAAQTTFCIGSSLLNPCKPFMDLWQRLGERASGFKIEVTPFDDDLLDDLECYIEKATGFHVLDHELKFFGLCRECMKQNSDLD